MSAKVLALILSVLIVGCATENLNQPAVKVVANWKDVTILHENIALVCEADGKILGNVDTYSDKDWFVFAHWSTSQPTFDTDSLAEQYASRSQAKDALEAFALKHSMCASRELVREGNRSR